MFHSRQYCRTSALREVLPQPFHCDLRNAVELQHTTVEHTALMQQSHCKEYFMQNTIAQHPQRRGKVTWNLQFHSARISKRKSMAKRGSPQPSHKRANFSPQRNLRLPEKSNGVSNPNIQIVSMRSASRHLQTQSESQNNTEENTL